MQYLPAGDEDKRVLLEAIGVSRIEDLFLSIPEHLRLKKSLELPYSLSEIELSNKMENLAGENIPLGKRGSFLGAGIYRHFIPGVVDYLTSRSEFCTAYTPYQPEISQGTLTAIFEFQTMMADLLGMDVCNASLYDGGSASAEAALMALRIKQSAKRILVAESLHPHYRQVIDTYLKNLPVEIIKIPYENDGRIDLSILKTCLADSAILIIGEPNFFGVIEDIGEIKKTTDEKCLLGVITNECMSFGVIEPPGRFGADIVAGDASSFGLSPSLGGPALGFLSSKREFMRQIPGRIVGETKDKDGKRGFVLTLSTREQHIRREKATSNICTNEGLCLLSAAIHMALLGRKGIEEVSNINLSKSEYLKSRLDEIGIKPIFQSPTFNEFSIQLSKSPSIINDILRKEGIIGGLPLECHYSELQNTMLIAVTEIMERATMDRFVEILKDIS